MALVRITSIDKNDAYYHERDELIGLEGEAEDISHTGHELYSFMFKPPYGESICLLYAGIQLLDRKVNRHYGRSISD
jgi:hypothetical protein